MKYVNNGKANRINIHTEWLHYGYLIFRPRYPLSFFDSGLERYTGNSVFLEAHKQNTANFSEAGFSSGMLRFGEISIAMILQILFHYLSFFLVSAVSLRKGKTIP